jgi:hypothetical protein
MTGVADIPVAAGLLGWDFCSTEFKSMRAAASAARLSPALLRGLAGRTFWPHELESGQSLSDWRKHQRTAENNEPVLEQPPMGQRRLLALRIVFPGIW